jgi:hypothetical protein
VKIQKGGKLIIRGGRGVWEVCDDESEGAAMTTTTAAAAAAACLLACLFA